ncbi:MAG TPA: DinB family protein [Bacilli bacterium]
MFASIAEFNAEWSHESASTQKVLDALTDASLKQQVTPEGRTLGRLAWHVVTSIPGMLDHFGLTVAKVEGEDVVPATARQIAETHRQVSAAAAEAVKRQWTDESLTETQNVFGRDMTRAAMLSLMIKHIIHHRGQMTVLMRQAGLEVPGVYGPTREDWSRMGVAAPK